MRNWQKARMMEHLEQIESYHGTFTETGILDPKEDLVTEIWFKAPLRYYMVVRSPKKYEGTTLQLNGSELKIYYPQSRFAIITRNIPAITREQAKQIITQTYDHNVKYLNYELGKTGSVAGHPTIEVKFNTRNPESIVVSGNSYVFDKFSFPLSSSLKYVGGANYGIVFKSIEFNNVKTIPELKIPDEALLSEWDTMGKSYTEAEVRKSTGLKFHIPNPQGMKLTKIIKQAGMVPAYTVLYDGYPFSISMMVFRNYGVSLVPGGRGLKVPAGTINGELIPNPHVNTYSFIHGEAQYVIMGNVPAERILAMAKEIGAQPQAAAAP
ncbi:MAG: hypothetical protein V4692_01390 [Bdellovibrionota bacterium]